MNARPRLAVVGCGYWGSKHVRVSFENNNARLTLAVDARQDRLDRVGTTYPGVATAREFEAALADDIDGVVLATPISTHYTLARQALEAGKHVLVEKPLATTADQCRDLIALAARNHCVLMVGHTFEYHPAVVYLRDLIQHGDLGDLYYIDCARLNLGLFQPDADVLWDLAPHDLSILFFLLGQPAQGVSAWGRSHILPGVPDVVHATVSFPRNVTAFVHVSWLDPVKVRRVTIVGSRGMAVFNDVTPTEKVRIYDKSFTPGNAGDRYTDFQASYHNGNVVIPPLGGGEPLALEVQDFVGAISAGRPARCDGYAGLRVVEALEAASRSLRSGEQAETCRTAGMFPGVPLEVYADLAGQAQDNGHAVAD